MKTKIHGIVFSIFATMSLLSCTEDWTSDFNQNNFSGPTGGMGGGTSSGLIDFETLSTFTVTTDTSDLTEYESIPTDVNDASYNEYVENNFNENYVTTITYNGKSNATVTGLVDGDTVSVNGGHVELHSHAKGLHLTITGSTTEGSLKVYSEKKFCLTLRDASISNPEGAAINLQHGNCFLVLSGQNSLSDASGAAYTKVGDEDMRAVLFCEDKLRISGSGKLSITALNAVGKGAIACDDALFIRPKTNIQIAAGASAGNGIKAKDGLVVKGGVLNIETAGVGSKGLSSDADLQIDGGRIAIITTGGVDTSDASSPSGCAAIKCDSTLCINGGELHLKSTGQGGKGISCDERIDIAGGDIYLITEGSAYGTSSSSQGPGGGKWGGQSATSSNSVSPKGIRCDKEINISGGNLYIRTSGSNAEGIESKTTLTFSGGNTAALAYDDGFNAKTINISGGKAMAVSHGNCDGMDSNGAITASGGVLIGISSTLSSEDGIDCESTLTLSNATVIGLSGGGMGGSRISGHYISTNVSGTAGDYVALTNGSSPLITFKLPRTYSSGKLLLSTPTLASGTYSLLTGVTPTGGTLWMNYLEGCSSVSGGSSSSVSVTN